MSTKNWQAITVRLPPELYQMLEDYAFSKRMTKSDVVRLLLAKDLGADPLHQEAIVQANARANAYGALTKVLEEAFIRFKNQ